MSKLADAIAAEKRIGGTRCEVCKFLAQAPKDIRADFDAAIGGELSSLSRGLKSLGYRLSPGQLSRHRSGTCMSTRS